MESEEVNHSIQDLDLMLRVGGVETVIFKNGTTNSCQSTQGGLVDVSWSEERAKLKIPGNPRIDGGCGRPGARAPPGHRAMGRPLGHNGGASMSTSTRLDYAEILLQHLEVHTSPRVALLTLVRCHTSLRTALTTQEQPSTSLSICDSRRGRLTGAYDTGSVLGPNGCGRGESDQRRSTSGVGNGITCLPASRGLKAAEVRLKQKAATFIPVTA